MFAKQSELLATLVNYEMKATKSPAVHKIQQRLGTTNGDWPLGNASCLLLHPRATIYLFGNCIIASGVTIKRSTTLGAIKGFDTELNLRLTYPSLPQLPAVQAFN